MRFGPTRLQVAAVLAKGLRRPKLRADLRISEQTIAGAKTYVIKIPETSIYNRYGAYEYELLTLCDGGRTPSEIASEMSQRHPERAVAEKTVLEFFDTMEPGMWEQSLGEKNLALLERIRDERKNRVNRSNLLQITFSAWDPDKTLARLDPYLGWIFTRQFVVFSVSLFVLTAILWATDWTRISEDTGKFYDLSSKTPADLVVYWVLLLALGGIHEFGHGLSCKHFGGEVHQMGFMLIYFAPAFYTDTTDVYLFDRTSKREWVIFAGIWVELVICGLATLVWYFATPGSALSTFAYQVVLFSGFMGLVFNLDPFIKADGYYALSQYLHMESLREESFAYLRACFERYILQRDVELPTVTQRQRRIFLTYGVAAYVYSVALLALVSIWLKNTLTGSFDVWGYPIGALLIFFMFRKRIREATPAVRAWILRRREEYMAWKVTRAQQLGAAAIAFLLVVPPMPSRVSSDFVLEPGDRAEIRAAVPGQISEVRVRQGESVPKGAVVAILHNPEIEARTAILEQELALAEGRVRAAESRASSDEIAKAASEATRLREDLSVAQTRLGGLTVLAPFEGLVATPQMEQRVGEYVSEGDTLLSLVNRRTMRARILVRDWDLQQVKEGAAARLKVMSYPFRTYSGHVGKILPAAALDRPVSQPEKVERFGQELTNYFAVILEFPNADDSLREGMTGTAKISGRFYPLAWQAGRSVWRWINTQVW
ncbi:MAG: HlyD family efflux transporter periplasmic adaptor subunit [Candidatus Acidiferrales bacterium]